MALRIAARWIGGRTKDVLFRSSKRHLRVTSGLFNLGEQYDYAERKVPRVETGKEIDIKKPIQNEAESITSDNSVEWPEFIKKFMEQEHITTLTSIQQMTLSHIMNGKDLVGVARTGSGKSLAFVIPAVIKIIEKKMPGPSCLVLSPTRELAAQTTTLFAKFRKFGVKSIALVGGASRAQQVNDLNRITHDVYIATPGRLMDLVDDGVTDLSNIQYLVLDEADRMLDMGFEPQITKICEQLSQNRQTVMWSATWPREIRSLAQKFMKEYEYVAVDSETLKANPNIKQIVEICSPHEKFSKLMDHIKKFRSEIEKPRILIFVNQKKLANNLMMQLMRARMRAVTMHGDLSQRQRDDSLRYFRSGDCNIMIATDVAARGLDISDITHVYNFCIPTNIEDYVHRIGRTARHDRKGTSISLVTDEDGPIVKKLIKVLQETNQEIPEELLVMARNNYVDYDARPQRRKMNNFYNGNSYQNRSSRGNRFDSAPRRNIWNDDDF